MSSNHDNKVCVTVEGIDFNVEKDLLIEHSEFFEHLFKSSMKEVKENRVTLEEESAVDFTIVLNHINHISEKTLIDFGYAIDFEHIRILLHFSDKYLMRRLKKFCIYRMLEASKWEYENVFKIAEEFNLETLLDLIITRILQATFNEGYVIFDDNVFPTSNTNTIEKIMKTQTKLLFKYSNYANEIETDLKKTISDKLDDLSHDICMNLGFCKHVDYDSTKSTINQFVNEFKETLETKFKEKSELVNLE